MKDWLSGLGDEYEIEILFACEAGSRAWGIETDQSDFDIRFIFRHRDIKEYLSLRKTKNILDFRSPFDVTGFDLYKVCDLILKSNPSLYEWAYSSLIYTDKNQFSLHLKKMIENSYSPFSLFMHYSSLKKRNVKELVKGDYNVKKQKQLIQAIRADLLCSGLIETKSVLSPYDHIHSACGYNPRVFEAYLKVTEAKKKQMLLSETEVNEMICLLSKEKFDEGNLPLKNQPSIDMIENWLWSLLGI
jgi:uncharacterized protein